MAESKVDDLGVSSERIFTDKPQGCFGIFFRQNDDHDPFIGDEKRIESQQIAGRGDGFAHRYVFFVDFDTAMSGVGYFAQDFTYTSSCGITYDVYVIYVR